MNPDVVLDASWALGLCKAACVLSTRTVLIATLPYALAALAFRHVSVLRRAGPPVFFAVCLAANRLLEDDTAALVSGVALGYAYYVGIALVTYLIASLAQRGGLTAGELAFVCLGLYLVVPSMLFRGSSAVETLTFGWNAMLAAYSYCRDAKRLSPNTSLHDCCSFIVLDPTLVFPLRATRSDTEHAGGRLLLLGTCSLFIAQLTERFARALLTTTSATALPPLVLGVLSATSASLVLYAGFAGFANVRAGLLGLLGYRTTPCFLSPYLATTPADFWRRWNTWVGGWAHRSVFAPLASKSLRWQGRRARSLGKGLALVVTFVTVGLLHDVLIMLNERRLAFPFTAAFGIAGTFVVLGDMLEHLRVRFSVSRSLAHSLFVLSSRGLTFIHVVAVLRAAGFV